jgi:hypothetical protein
MMRNSGAMELLVYNPQKGRLETIKVEITEENTTWFKDTEKGGDIATITDVDGCLLVSTHSYDYPVLVYDLSRADIGHSKKKARKIMREYV